MYHSDTSHILNLYSVICQIHSIENRKKFYLLHQFLLTGNVWPEHQWMVPDTARKKGFASRSGALFGRLLRCLRVSSQWLPPAPSPGWLVEDSLWENTSL